MKGNQKVYHMEIEPEQTMETASHGSTSITNLDKLIEVVGNKTVEYLFTEYVMRMTAKAGLLDKIQNAVDNGADMDAVKEIFNGTDSDDSDKDSFVI